MQKELPEAALGLLTRLYFKCKSVSLSDLIFFVPWLMKGEGARS